MDVCIFILHTQHKSKNPLLILGLIFFEFKRINCLWFSDDIRCRRSQLILKNLRIIRSEIRKKSLKERRLSIFQCNIKKYDLINAEISFNMQIYSWSLTSSKSYKIPSPEVANI